MAKKNSIYIIPFIFITLKKFRHDKSGWQETQPIRRQKEYNEMLQGEPEKENKIVQKRLIDKAYVIYFFKTQKAFIV